MIPRQNRLRLGHPPNMGRIEEKQERLEEIEMPPGSRGKAGASGSGLLVTYFRRNHAKSFPEAGAEVSRISEADLECNFRN